MKRLNQKGFGLIESLLIVIALALVVFVGYYVWHTQQQDDKTPTNSSQTSDPSSSTEQITYLEVDEIGIKIPLSQALKDSSLSYEVAPEPTTVGLTTPEFDAAVEDCADPGAASGSFKPLISITKVPGIYDEGSSSIDVYSSFLKQFSDFYLTYGRADGGYCSGSNEAKQNAVKKLFEQLSPEVETALKQSELL